MSPFHPQEVCHCLDSLGSKSHCFDIVQNGICKYLVRASIFISLNCMLNAIVTKILLTWQHYPESNTCMCYVSVKDQANGGAWQYGGRAAESSFEISGPINPAYWAHVTLLVPLLLLLTGSAHHPPAVAWGNQPQKVCVDTPSLHWSLLGRDPLLTCLGLKWVCPPLLETQYGEPACRRWAPFLACSERFCSWCRLKIWRTQSCLSLGRFCQCCCSTRRFTASWWPAPPCYKTSYNTSR